MDMDLQRVPLEGFRPVYQALLRQEETLESIVPDALPDIVRIVECSGSVFLRQKETVDGSVRVTGTVRAAVFYLPEGGGDPCCMTLNIPFLCNGDHPVIRESSRTKISLKVISADAQVLNPRKVLARVEVGVCADVYGEEDAEICCKAQCENDPGLQTLRESHKDFAVINIAEKHVSFSDVLRLSAIRPAVKQVLTHRAEISCAEAKAIGKKLVVKGEAVLTVLYLGENGTAAARFELPFSQIIEMGTAFEECEACAEVVLTGLHCEERNEGELEVTIEALIQATLRREREVSMVADLYSVARALDVERQKVVLHQLVEQGTQRQVVRQLCPMEEPVKQVVECRLTVGETSLIPDGTEKSMATAKVYVNILYLSEEDALHSAAYTVSAVCELPAFHGGKCSCRCAPFGEVTGTAVSGGVEVRFEAAFSYLVTRPMEVESVSAVRLGQQEDCASRHPSLRIRSVEAGERLWDIAKCCGSTVEDIQLANNMAGEELTKGSLLLVPRCR